MAFCAYCGHSKYWHHGSRIIDSDDTECLHPTVDDEGVDDECACTSFMTKKQYDALYPRIKARLR
jgi:hypothetical protein